MSVSYVGVLNRLMIGCCGGYEHSVLGPAADLLLTMFRHCPLDQLMQDMSLAFSQKNQPAAGPGETSQHHQLPMNNFFHLGKDAQQLVLQCLSRHCSSNTNGLLSSEQQGIVAWSNQDLKTFLEQIWDLHRSTDDASTLTDTDAVSRFLRRYTAGGSLQ